MTSLADIQSLLLKVGITHIFFQQPTSTALSHEKKIAKEILKFR